MPGIGPRAPVRPEGGASGPHTQESNENIPSSSSKSSPSTDSQNAPSRLLAEGEDRRAMSERFNVDTHTGGVSFRVPILTSPGRSGFGPSLELVYNSGSAGRNGVFGVGWQLTGVESISRKTTVSVPTYNDDQDVFVHSTAGDLVPVMLDEGGFLERDEDVDGRKYRVRLYRARVESDSIRAQRWMPTDKDGSLHWRVISSGNITTILGADSSSQIFYAGAAGGSTACFSWLASEAYDSHGNQMIFSYKGENVHDILASDLGEAQRNSVDIESQRYLKSIKYGNKTPNRDMQSWNPLRQHDNPGHYMFEVVLDYGEHTAIAPTTQEDEKWDLRPDPYSAYNSGFEIRTYRRCRRVLMFHHFPLELARQDCLVAATEFHYETDDKSGGSVLTSCTPCHYSPAADGRYSCLRLATSTFQYCTLPDLKNISVEEMKLDLAGLSTGDGQWVDLDGAGTPGVLSTVPGGDWYYRPNESQDEPSLGMPRLVPSIPYALTPEQWRFTDITGNGQLDVVSVSLDGQVRGFYERTGREWSNFVPFASYPTVEPSKDPNFRQIDLNGNGLGDLLYMAAGQSDEFSWYPALGRQGYGKAEFTSGAPGIPSGEDRAVLFSDMTGDGLSDIVLIYNNSISYWPNMGHGRFHSKVTMQNPPFLGHMVHFSPLRIRLADITGTGTADLIYLPPDGGLKIFYNQSGNSWSDAFYLSTFPSIDRFCAVDIFDIGGRGTQCLCWTSDYQTPGSTTVRFLDLMGGCKPGMLTECTNGIGAVVAVKYRASTRYRRDDEYEGRPWTTQLPFPIHCVQSLTTHDLVAQTSSNISYAYWNGHYDPAERQFRGFQMVDEWESENFATIPEVRFNRPPLHRRTWFYIGLEDIDTDALPGSYQAQQSPLPEEAYRALSGQRRRQEIYSDDGNPRSSVPYLTTEQAYNAVMHQSTRGGHRHAIFRVNSREELTVTYDRDPEDPKIQQSLILQTDNYGNVCRQAVVYYGKARSGLEKAEDRQKQEETMITYSETAYTNPLDPLHNSSDANYFQSPLSSEVRQYRVFPGKNWKNQGGGRYNWEDMSTLLPLVNSAPLDQDPTTSGQITESGFKILTSNTRSLYSKPALDGPLPLGKVKPFSIEYQSYQLVFTERLLEETLKNSETPLLTPPKLIQELKEGGYVNLDGQSDRWWTASSRKLFLDDIETRSSSLSVARSQFFVPNAEVDPYGNISHQQSDPYRILPVKKTDAVGNEVLFRNDYLHLKPALVTDPNENQTASIFDPCGRVVGIARMGKDGQGVGDSLDGFAATLTKDQLNSFLDDPSGPITQELIGKAGRRTIYHDLYDASRTPAVPAFYAELIRQTHYADSASSAVSVHITYLNGSGQSIQDVSLSGNTEAERKWQVSNFTICDIKGQPVREFLPSTQSTHHFKSQEESKGAFATTTLRDHLSRDICVLNPDRTWSKVQILPWSQAIFDAGDTVEISNPAEDEDVRPWFEQMNQSWYLPTWYTLKSNGSKEDRLAANKSRIYNNTPKSIHVDAMSREIVSYDNNGIIEGKSDIRFTRTVYDERGNPRELRDALGRLVTAARYDLLGRPLHTINMDNGHRWLLPASDGGPLLTWSSGTPGQRVQYDNLRRKKLIQLMNGESVVTIVEYVYGDDANMVTPTSAKKNNLRGQLHQRRDQSGKQTHENFDFKGNSLVSSIRFAIKYDALLDWSGDVALEEDIHTTTILYDAVDRPVCSETLDGPRKLRVTQRYDVAGRLKSTELTGLDGSSITTSVRNIEYADDDRILLIQYGNGSQTRNVYEPDSHRLVNSRNERNNITPTCFQNMHYVYDCLGRIVQQTDDAQKDNFIANSPVLAMQTFSYDALGQLSDATGREQIEPSEKHLRPYSVDGEMNNGGGPGRQTIPYKESYQYDLAGNIRQVKHVPVANGYTGWTRVYKYEEPSFTAGNEFSNRLSRTSTGRVTDVYSYDGDATGGNQNGYNDIGCTTSIPGYAVLEWDHDSRLRCFTTQKVTQPDATPQRTWYIYNADGQRVRKVTDSGTSTNGRSSSVKTKQTIYLPHRDIYSTFNGDGVSKNRETLTANVGDSNVFASPMSLVEYTSGEEKPLVRYQVSENLELDSDSKIISYEEFSPFGSCTYQAPTTQAPRKYRFARYHRDTESGLYLCGERYYACWLGRWISPDPLGTVDGLNLYAYVHNDPVNLEDHPGTMAKRKKPSPEPETSRYTPTTSTGMQKAGIERKAKPINDSTLAHLAKKAYDEIRRMPENKNPKTSYMPNCLTALRLPDERTVILASSIRSASSGRDHPPNEYTEQDTTQHTRDLIGTTHRTAACGEIMAIETWFRMNPEQDALPAGMAAVSYGTEYNNPEAKTQLELGKTIFKAPCTPNASERAKGLRGCTHLLQDRIRAIQEGDIDQRAQQLPNSCQIGRPLLNRQWDAKAMRFADK
ncbi:virulence plasmid 65kDa B protein-domain-containing protein [Aspergillus transmontanensis]|uniref:Virulence plasmid 65kDa B protein-domain-containing protein n=1 Tax=Aspergillus transmontanensis TaxID=1034304 RepID=A0A5N6VLD7_9EURO|nr:virulence plasmid 65kDa B protein-domain-containing protein [Aspergillus transmontanensis]